MKVSKKVFASLLAVMMLRASIISPNADDERDITKIISEDLFSIMYEATDYELIPVCIWLNDIDTNIVENAVKESVGICKQDIWNASEFERLNTQTDTYSLKGTLNAAQINMPIGQSPIPLNSVYLQNDNIDTYIATERSVYAEMQMEESMSFIEEYADIIIPTTNISNSINANMNENNIENIVSNSDIFVSKYAPLISTKLTKASIEKIANDYRVDTIYYAPTVELESAMNISVPLVRADYVRDTLGYTGSGVKVGICETNGFPDLTNGYFNTNVVFDPNVDSIHYDSHATRVAGIICGSVFVINGSLNKGIANKANLYATWYSDATNSLRGIEWLIDNNVDVINLSASMPSNTDEYIFIDAWYDHIAINHDVHFVVAAGNEGNGNGYITSPAKAYNVISVGAIDDKNTTSQSDDVRSSYSSYIEASSCTNKPDLVAPGTNITTMLSAESGTSFAAPHVTAIIAQLLEQRPALKTQQDVVKAILTAGVSHDTLSYSTNSGDNFDKCGAGLVDARSASYIISNYKYVQSSFAANSSNNSYKTYTFNVSSSDTIVRVSLSWLKCNKFTSSINHDISDPMSYTLANLDLYVYDPNGNLVSSATSTNNNLEIVKFVPVTYGTYTIKVVQKTNSNAKVNFGLAWW